MDGIISIFPFQILEPDSVTNCVSRGKSEDYDCRNHIRVIQKIDEKRLYVCGTNAHSPKDLVMYANLTHLARHEFYAGVGDGKFQNLLKLFKVEKILKGSLDSIPSPSH